MYICGTFLLGKLHEIMCFVQFFLEWVNKTLLSFVATNGPFIQIFSKDNLFMTILCRSVLELAKFKKYNSN